MTTVFTERVSPLAIRLAQPLSTRQSVTQFFGSSAGLAVTYNAVRSIWVACGNGLQGNICYSTNGIDWLPATNNFFVTASGVACSDSGRFVAVGYGTDGTIAYSDDGKLWFAATTDFFVGGEGFGVAYGDGVWLAVGYGNNGTIARSTDGIVWTASTDFFGGGGRGRGVAYSPSLAQWVAVGGGPQGNICHSDDGGVTFSVSGTFFVASSGYGVAWGGGKWIAVGTNGLGTRSIGQSTDGVNWSSVDNFFVNGIGKSIAYNPTTNVWVAVGFGNRGTIGYSVDGGQVWQSSNSLFDGGAGGMSVAFGGAESMEVRCVAVGATSSQMVTIGVSTANPPSVFASMVEQSVSGILPAYLPLIRLLTAESNQPYV